MAPEDKTAATSESAPSSGSNPGSRPSIWGRYSAVPERAMLPIAFVLLMIGFSFANDNFLTGANVSSVLGSQAVLLVLAMALLVPLTNGDIDLSVGAIAGLVSMTVAVLNVEHGIGIGL